MTSPYSGPSPLPAGGSGADGGQGGGGGGSGSGTSLGQQPIRDVNGAYQLLKAAFTKWPNCAALFGGQYAVNAYAAGMTFVDGRRPGDMNMAGDRNNNQAFATYHARYPSVRATTLLGRNGAASKTVVLWSDFFGPPNLSVALHSRMAEEQMQTLIHEFIHSRFNLTSDYHWDVVARFSITVKALESPTDAIDQWITGNCRN